MPELIHFEIPADDVERAREFYSRLFGWEIEKVPELDYWMISTGGEKGPGGGLIKRKDPKQVAVNYIGVPSIDEYAEKVKGLGGSIVVPRTAVAGWGYFAICLDEENNAFGLWEDDKGAG